MRIFIIFIFIFWSFFSQAKYMTKISDQGDVFVIPNENSEKFSSEKSYSLIYNNKVICGKIIQTKEASVPSLYKICKSNFQSSVKFSQTVKKSNIAFPIGLLVEGCNSVFQKTHIKNPSTIKQVKSFLNWNRAYEKLTLHRLALDEESYFLLKGIYYTENKEDSLQNKALFDFALINNQLTKTLFKKRNQVCCDSLNYFDCTKKNKAIKMCTSLSADKKILGLFKSNSSLNSYSLGFISEGFHAFTWSILNQKKKQTFHNYAYSVEGCQ